MTETAFETQGTRLAWARRNAGYQSAAEAARGLGIPEVTYRTHEKGTRLLHQDVAQRYADFFRVQWSWLMTGVGEAQPNRDAPIEPATPLPPGPGLQEPPHPLDRFEIPSVGMMPLDVPVYGVAVGGESADFCFNGSVIDRVRRPPGIQAARNVFAIFVVGDSMSPRYEEGDLVYLNPDRPPRPGEDVVIEMAPERDDDGDHPPCYIKRLLRRTATKLICRQFNPARDNLTYDVARIKHVYRIIPAAELLGL